MKRVKFIAIVFFMASSVLMNAQSYTIDNTQSSLAVHGTSTLHDWKLNAKTVKGMATLEVKGKELKGIKSLSIEVPVATMNSGLEALDTHMETAMTANNASVVTFILTEVTSLTANSIGSYAVQADGKISIIKNSKPVALQATIEIKENGAIRIFGETQISMTDYQVEPPQAEMGSIKTEDEVKVVFDVVFVK